MLVNSVSGQNFGKCSISKNTKNIIEVLRTSAPTKHADIFEAEVNKFSDFINLRTPWFKRFKLQLSTEQQVRSDIGSDVIHAIKVSVANGKKSVSTKDVPYMPKRAINAAGSGETFDYDKAQNMLIKEMQDLKKKFTEMFLK